MRARYFIETEREGNYTFTMHEVPPLTTTPQETDPQVWSEITHLTTQLVALKPRIEAVSPPVGLPQFETPVIATGDITGIHPHIFNEWAAFAELSPIEVLHEEPSSWFQLVIKPKDGEGLPTTSQTQTKDVAMIIIYSLSENQARGWRVGGTFTDTSETTPVAAEPVIITALRELFSQSAEVLEHQQAAATPSEYS